VILFGVMIAIWGGLVLGFAKTMHVRWKGMLSEMRRAGIGDTLALTRWFASPEGLRGMRIAGAAALVAGLGMIAVGLVQGRGL
jgi:hypothetical protein